MKHHCVDRFGPQVLFNELSDLVIVRNARWVALCSASVTIALVSWDS